MRRGVILIALNHPHYCKLAYQLALSIKFNNPGCHITLLHNYETFDFLSSGFERFVDNRIFLEPELYTQNGRFAVSKTKLAVDLLSPYEETIYLDVDGLVLRNRNVHDFFKYIDKHNFAITYDSKPFDPHNKDHQDHTFWVSFKSIKNLFDFPEGVVNASDCQTSVVVFRKNKNGANSLFDAAREIFNVLDQNRSSLSERGLSIWYNTIPDELCIWLAMVKTKEPLPASLYHDILWPQTLDHEIKEDRIYFTIPSALSYANKRCVLYYNDLLNYYCLYSGVNPLTYWIDKPNLANTKAFMPLSRQVTGILKQRFLER